ncbi:hypothetical protein [Falsibacillus albus]|nr:hypothetical protein [Falsibacillus albus]
MIRQWIFIIERKLITVHESNYTSAEALANKIFKELKNTQE